MCSSPVAPGLLPCKRDSKVTMFNKLICFRFPPFCKLRRHHHATDRHKHSHTATLDVDDGTGPKEELQPLLEALKEEGVFVRELSTCDVAYHSPLLDPLLPELSAGASVSFLC